MGARTWRTVITRSPLGSGSVPEKLLQCQYDIHCSNCEWLWADDMASTTSSSWQRHRIVHCSIMLKRIAASLPQLQLLQLGWDHYADKCSGLWKSSSVTDECDSAVTEAITRNLAKLDGVRDAFELLEAEVVEKLDDLRSKVLDTQPPKRQGQQPVRAVGSRQNRG